jgi:hypothetical protein
MTTSQDELAAIINTEASAAWKAEQCLDLLARLSELNRLREQVVAVAQVYATLEVAAWLTRSEEAPTQVLKQEWPSRLISPP